MIIAATGHRPPKLGGFSPHARESLTRFAVNWLQRSPITLGITGMALGWDTAFAVGCLRLGIPVVAAVPCESQASQWPEESRATYFRILSFCAQVTLVSTGPYMSWMTDARNRWMVDRCESVIALWNGSPGGTKNCLEYAGLIDRPFSNPWHAWQEWTCKMPASSIILPAAYL